MRPIELIDRAVVLEMLPQICDALNGCDAPYNFDEHCVGCEVYMLHKMLTDMPTIDAVPVVRCKDCALRGDDKCPMMWWEEIVTDDDGWSEYNYAPHDCTTDDGFCHMGRRADDETD